MRGLTLTHDRCPPVTRGMSTNLLVDCDRGGCGTRR